VRGEGGRTAKKPSKGFEKRSLLGTKGRDKKTTIMGALNQKDRTPVSMARSRWIARKGRREGAGAYYKENAILGNIN